MESEIEESLSTKRRKTDTHEQDNFTSENVSSEASDTAIADSEDFLQDFLSRRPPSDLSLYQRVIIQEEEEAKTRDPTEDLKLFKDACADFSDCVAEIAELKANKPEGWKDKVNEIRKDAAYITLIIKKLNRIEKTRMKLSREKVNKERQSVDTAHVRLDNMLCEIQHLRKEIDKCLKFKLKPFGIDLIPVQQFYEEAPITVSKPEITKTNEHQLQLARLEWELKQRKELSALLNNLENKKSSISERIDKKEKDLSSLAPLIKHVLKVTQPLKEKLGHSQSQRLKTTIISDNASLLPDPLYVLYVEGSAYSDAYEKGMHLEIKGDLDEARRFRDKPSSSVSEKKDLSVNTIIESMDCPNTDFDSEKSQLLIVHPLSVAINMPIKDGTQLELKFSYMKNLQIMTVIPLLNVPSSMKTLSSSSEIIFNSRSLLHNLFTGDNAEKSPNLMNFYQFNQVGIKGLDVDVYGYPFAWVQSLGGLQFLKTSLGPTVETKVDYAKTTLIVVIRELKRRCLFRLSLLGLIADLEKGNIVAPSSMKSVKVVSKLKSIQGISWSEYCDHPLSDHFKNSKYISENDMHFIAVIKSGEAILTCLISVKPDYPTSPSVFALHLDYPIFIEPNTYTLDIEKEVNIYWRDLLTSRIELPFLLSHQIFKVMVCFDIVLTALDPHQTLSSKQFPETFRGRNRALPFKYVPEDNLFVHRT